MARSRLIQMREQDFDELKNKVVPRTIRIEDPSLESKDARNWIFYGYCSKLIIKNTKLMDLFEKYEFRLDNPDCWDQLSQGQQIIYPLYSLDGQVRNGGLAQFFWNRFDLIFYVSDALSVLGLAELSMIYDKSLEVLFGNRNKWIELRNRPATNPDSFWQPFQETYELLDLEPFDDAYFGGYGDKLIDLMMNYIYNNKYQFIESPLA